MYREQIYDKLTDVFKALTMLSAQKCGDESSADFHAVQYVPQNSVLSNVPLIHYWNYLCTSLTDEWSLVAAVTLSLERQCADLGDISEGREELLSTDVLSDLIVAQEAFVAMKSLRIMTACEALGAESESMYTSCSLKSRIDNAMLNCYSGSEHATRCARETVPMHSHGMHAYLAAAHLAEAVAQSSGCTTIAPGDFTSPAISTLRCVDFLIILQEIFLYVYHPKVLTLTQSERTRNRL